VGDSLETPAIDADTNAVRKSVTDSEAVGHASLFGRADWLHKLVRIAAEHDA
jgi:hypothetical protein